MQQELLLEITRSAHDKGGMDALIISTNTQQQQQFWQKRLDALRGELIRPDAFAVAVWEDWPDGAGSALGTLYAYQKGRDRILSEHGVDLFEKQREGASIAIYHTAGKGSRLAPLTLSEGSNKSAVRLPGFIQGSQQITVLEAVIKQTAPYAKTHPGRLLVFWGDQIFIPSQHHSEPKEHIALFGKQRPIPTASQWQTEKLERYGLILNSSQQIDKLDFPTFNRLTAHEQFSISLGSFSLSGKMTCALMREFAEELRTKRGKMDVEPHLWMPLTLERTIYLEVMQQKGHSLESAVSHFSRIQKWKDSLPSPLFGSIDIGEKGLWWDYGTVDAYYHHHMQLLQKSDEAKLMRLFYQMEEQDDSQLIGCRIGSGIVRNSLLIGVEADHVDISNSVVINTKAASLDIQNSLAYQVNEPGDLRLHDGMVRADAKGEIPLYTQLGRDGKADWNEKLFNNAYSYAELFLQD